MAVFVSRLSFHRSPPFHTQYLLFSTVLFCGVCRWCIAPTSTPIDVAVWIRFYFYYFLIYGFENWVFLLAPKKQNNSSSNRKLHILFDHLQSNVSTENSHQEFRYLFYILFFSHFLFGYLNTKRCLCNKRASDLFCVFFFCPAITKQLLNNLENVTK